MIAYTRGYGIGSGTQMFLLVVPRIAMGTFTTEVSMRNIVFSALIAALLSGCAANGDMSADSVARQNADFRVWPEVVQGQAFPVQHLYDGD